MFRDFSDILFVNLLYWQQKEGSKEAFYTRPL